MPTNNKTATIIENAEELSVSLEDARRLWKEKFIYKCRECHCYHIQDGHDMDDIEHALLKSQPVCA